MSSHWLKLILHHVSLGHNNTCTSKIWHETVRKAENTRCVCDVTSVENLRNDLISLQFVIYLLMVIIIIHLPT